MDPALLASLASTTAEEIAVRSPCRAEDTDAVEQAALFLHNAGLVHIRAPAIEPALLSELCAAATASYEEVTAQLTARGVDYRSEQFRFREVASRCPGRLDIRLKPSRLDPGLTEDSACGRVARCLLGEDAALNYGGVVWSLPGSEDQGWHTDGEHLFPMQLPAHAVTVFVALVDVTPELGGTQFFAASHIRERAAQLQEGTEGAPLSLEMRAGEVVLMDYRVIHRGMANRHPEQPRPLLYLVFSKPWFADVRNFSREASLFP